MTRPAAITCLLALAYLVLALLGTALGAVHIPPGHVLRILTTSVMLEVDRTLPFTERFLVLHVRLPQVLLLGSDRCGAGVFGGGLAERFSRTLWPTRRCWA